LASSKCTSNNASDDIIISEVPHAFLQDKDALSALKDGTSLYFLLPDGIEIPKIFLLNGFFSG
jgi:hypothetical protein